MHIDQTKLTDNVVKNIPTENAGIGIENYMIKSEPQGFFATKSESYSSGKTSGISASGNVNMSNATYQKPFSEEEKKDFAEKMNDQMNMSAEDRKNQMVVISNTTTAEDYQKMQEDGFSFSNTSSQTIITETDKIKAVLAKAGVDISIYGDGLSADEIDELAGNAAVAAQIESQMRKTDIPVTSDNMDESKKAYSEAMQIGALSEDAIAYMLKNGLEPTIDNLYRAQFSSQTMVVSYQQEQAMSDEQLADMIDQIEQIIKDAGIKVDDASVDESKWLIKNGIALNGQTLSYLQQLRALNVNVNEAQKVIENIVKAIEEGGRPEGAMLIDGFSIHDIAENAMKTIENASDEDLEYIIARGETINIANLQIALNARAAGVETGRALDAKADIALVTAKRVLEETRLSMTFEANYALLKRGMSIDTKPLEILVEDLKQQESQYYRDLMGQNGVKVTEESVATFEATISTVEEIKWQPAYALTLNSADETLETLRANGQAVTADFEKANERYETMMTAPRADMGDSIRKAFQNVDDILKDLGLDVSKENQRAVRILAYNRTELSVSNINTIKAVDEEVQRTLKEMTPAVTLEMIRRGIQPLDLNISELNELASQIKQEIGDEDTDKFSKFLWKLEKNNQISEEERESYIGIYRLFAQVEKTDGAAIGSLINQGSDITMRNLLTAVRTKQKGAMDYTVSDDFSGVDAKSQGTRIDDQIMAAYQTNCVHDVMDMISPGNLEKLMQQDVDIEDMTPEQVKQAIEQADRELVEADQQLDYEYAMEQLSEIEEAVNSAEDIYKMLDRYDIQNSVINVISANRMMKNANQMFATLFNENNMVPEDIQKIRDIKEQILERFSDAIKTPEELAEAQEALAETAAHAMDNMIIEDRRASSIDIRQMRQVCNQFNIAAVKAREESFVVPVETSDGTITGISLKIVRGKEEKGFVDIFLNDEHMGKVAASFEAKEGGISGVVATSDEETRRLLADNLNMLVEAINENGQTNEAMDIRVAYIPEISSDHFEMSTLQKEQKIKYENPDIERTPVQTKRLYNIAESFVRTISELNNYF